MECFPSHSTAHDGPMKAFSMLIEVTVRRSRLGTTVLSIYPLYVVKTSGMPPRNRWLSTMSYSVVVPTQVTQCLTSLEALDQYLSQQICANVLRRTSRSRKSLTTSP